MSRNHNPGHPMQETCQPAMRRAQVCHAKSALVPPGRRGHVRGDGIRRSIKKERNMNVALASLALAYSASGLAFIAFVAFTH